MQANDSRKHGAWLVRSTSFLFMGVEDKPQPMKSMDGGWHTISLATQ